MTNKNTNKIIGISIAVILVLVIIGVIIFVQFPQESLINPEGLVNTETKLLSEDSSGATYEFIVNTIPRQSPSDCGVKTTHTIDLTYSPNQATSTLPPPVDGLDFSKEVTTTNVKFEGLNAESNLCSGSPPVGQEIVIEDEKAICTIRKETDTNVGITCRFMANVFTPDIATNIFGLSQLRAIVTFPKESGIIVGMITDTLGNPIEGATVSFSDKQATTSNDGSYTITDIPPQEGSLIANKPGFISTELLISSPSGRTANFDLELEEEEEIDQTISIYRFENNACSFEQILESERTSNDFETLEECNIKIDSGDDEEEDDEEEEEEEEEEDETPDTIISPTIIWISVGVLILFIIIIVVLIVRKK